MTIDSQFFAIPLVALVAALYSAVGHGGATGYLALMSFLNMPPNVMASSALTLNLLTAGISCYTYSKAGYFSARLCMPFIFTSIPCAFIGALIKLNEQQYSLLLSAVLIVTALSLVAKKSKAQDESRFVKTPTVPVAAAVGGCLGLISGAVGIGGGVFLSPIILLCNWADAKSTSAAASVFIIANSLSGLVGRTISGNLAYGNLLPLMIFAFLGATIGAHWGARLSSSKTLRRVLAVVLLTAALKGFILK